ncbi:MAG: hypothetical protein WKF84_13210 [Pyrinomonadaceae bacterium]
MLGGAEASADTKLEKALQDDPNLIALAILPVKGEAALGLSARCYQPR